MPPKNIVFIDSRVTGYQTLVADLGADTEWHLLTTEQDGVQQMQCALANHSGLGSIQIISHGAQGALYLGSTVLNSANLAGYQSQLQAIGSSLSQTGDILLYGCNVAQGDAGLGFVNALARITGADVAASDDLTGQAAVGGDVVLETASGSIESQALSLNGLQQPLAVNTAPTFTVSDGKLTTDLGGDDYGRSVIQQADGKLVVAGYTSAPSTDMSSSNFAMVRYKADGTLDTDFDGDGKLTTDFGLNAHDRGYSVIQQVDGKLVVAGYGMTLSDFALARYNLDGSLDTSFGKGGKLTTDLESISFDYGSSLIQQADGKLVVAGQSNNSFALARYNADGTLDTSFDGDGKLTTNFGLWASDYGNSVIQQADGKLVVAGASDNSFALARYNADGTLDTSFDGDGKLITNFGSNNSYGNSVIQQADGKLVVAGEGDNNFALARYNLDGSLDTSFGESGKQITDSGSSYASGYSIIQQADGKLVVVGYALNGNYNFALARYNADGTLDTSFNSDGKLTTDLGDDAFGRSVIQQANGKLVLAGNSGSNFALARYNPDGSLDNTFGPPKNTLQHNSKFTEGQYLFGGNGKVALAPNAYIFDAELSFTGHYGGSSITLSRKGGANAQDLFAGTGTLSTLTEGSYFSVDSVTIGRVTANSAGTLKLSFNSNATQSLVDKALQQVGYANTSDAPPASIQIDWVFGDGNTGAQGTGGAMAVTGSSTVTIVATNDAPVSSYLLQAQTALANAAFSYALPAGAFSDPDLETLKYSVSMADGSGVPPWLSINTATGTLSGTPESLDVGSFQLRITASDASGATASNNFTLTVTASSSAITGGSGNDSLTGQGGNDILKGYAGNDTLNGGLGSDNMDGGDGSDLYYVDNLGDVIVESSAATTGGVDTVYSNLSGYTLGANVENGRILNKGNASLSCNSLNNLLYAGAGDNTLDGQGGTDTVSYLLAAASVTVSLATTAAQDTESSGMDRLLNVENLTGSVYDDQLTGNAGANILNGGNGVDVMIGRNGNDTYYVDHADDVVLETSASSAGGQDMVYSTLASYTLTNNVENGRITTTAAASLTGNGLANTLYAGAGNNTLDGGAGTDTASYQYGLISGATAGVNVSLASTAGQATGRSGTDTLANIENLTGSNLNDILTGSIGSNILDGSLGADKLDGGAGNDTLIGGAGKDTLVGGNGNDSFDFNALSEMGTTSASWDVISGFVRGQDKIDLSTLDANTATTVDNAFNGTLIASTAKFSAAGQLKLASGVLYGNTDADADAEFAIQLTGITTLSAADFVL